MSLLTSAATANFTVERHFLPRRGDVRSQHRRQPQRCCDDIRRTRLTLQHTESHMQHEQSISDIDQHVQRFPNRSAEVREPEIVARRGHQKKDYEREETEGLERNTRDGTGERTSLENAQNGIGITARVVGDDNQHAVDKPEQAHRDARMAAIIEQREELFIQPAERSNAEDDVQENESRRTERANQQNFVRDEREPQFGEYTEENEKRAYAAEEHEIVNPLLPVPLDCAVFEAYVL